MPSTPRYQTLGRLTGVLLVGGKCPIKLFSPNDRKKRSDGGTSRGSCSCYYFNGAEFVGFATTCPLRTFLSRERWTRFDK